MQGPQPRLTSRRKTRRVALRTAGQLLTLVALVGGLLSWSSIGADGSRTPATLQSRALPRPQIGHRPSPAAEIASIRPTPTADAGEATHSLVAHAVTGTIVARQDPGAASPIMSTFAHPTAIGGPLVFQAVGPPVDGWIEVQLPVRPNGTTGWISADDVELTRNRYRVHVDVAKHALTIERDGEEHLTTTVAIGTGDTPTPLGDFYLTELLRTPDPDGLYGPFAYGLSGFSETLASFNDGPGVIGIHGTNRPDLLGTDVSHGCIRVENDVIAEIVRFLPLGTPISIQ